MKRAVAQVSIFGTGVRFDVHGTGKRVKPLTVRQHMNQMKKLAGIVSELEKLELYKRSSKFMGAVIELQEIAREVRLIVVPPCAVDPVVLRKYEEAAE